jgi:hypothetical protein
MNDHTTVLRTLGERRHSLQHSPEQIRSHLWKMHCNLCGLFLARCLVA